MSSDAGAALLGRLAERALTGSGPLPPPRTSQLLEPPVARPPVVPRPVSSTDWRSLVTETRRQRVSGVVAAAIASGALLVTDEQRSEAEGVHQAAMAIALVLERLTLGAVSLLADHGVDTVVLKGAAVAHLVYPDPAWRDFGDVDLLVPAEQLARATRVLGAAGAERQFPEPAPGWDRRFAKSVTMTHPSSYELDLHRTIAPGVFGLRVEPAELFGRTRPFVVAGTTLRGLRAEEQLLQACLHAAAGNREVWLSTVCDIVQLHRSGTVDPVRFRQLVERWGVAAAVERAVAIVGERLGEADVSPLTAGLTVRAADRRRLARYGGGFAAPAVTGFTALPIGWWPAYARALVWPSEASLAARQLSRIDHLRRLARYAGGSST